MKLFLLRHGDRSSGYGDVPLSSEGNRQAQDLAAQPALQNIDVILISPKVRTKQTVQPLADKLGIQARVENALDQRKSIETPNEFTTRVLHAMSDIAEKYPDKNVLVCSHSDWLQTAVLSMPSTRPDNAIHCFFSCADFKALNYKDGLWDIT
jgi:broad specificity phosphatase PhoE